MFCNSYFSHYVFFFIRRDIRATGIVKGLAVGFTWIATAMNSTDLCIWDFDPTRSKVESDSFKEGAAASAAALRTSCAGESAQKDSEDRKPLMTLTGQKRAVHRDER